MQDRERGLARAVAEDAKDAELVDDEAPNLRVRCMLHKALRRRGQGWVRRGGPSG